MSRPNCPPRRLVLGLAAGTVAFALIGAAPTDAARASHDRGPRTRVLVQLRSAADVPAIVDQQRSAGGRIRHLHKRALAGLSADLTGDAMRELEQDRAVMSVTAVPRATASDTQASPGWDLDRIDQRPRALNAGYADDTNGAGVTAYVVDTGIQTSNVQFGGRAST